jgi:hypothetical protein
MAKSVERDTVTARTAVLANCSRDDVLVDECCRS